MMLDILWFSISVPKIYMPKFTEIQKEEPQMLSKMHGGIFAWLLLVIGIYYFVLPLSNNIIDALKYGALYGLIVYGVYNGTNYVTFNKYDGEIFFADLSWGIFACSVVAAIAFMINK
jgi:uncharacterized membrane protein